ncbi:hypothetical protein BJ322DRAFT_1216551 [Thelephora terrestris]|uniref:Uncharacterized protein n=1 Tax=Thelephora terrestris TaxID=56493 RepID=A0A9P6LBE1_9AGAM|nr:hypothetical protein BJ322DRAFT_1216551 [Thelephora terrestris]
MSFPNNHTYKVANGISTISRINRRATARKTYANAAGTPYTTDDQILEVVKEVDTERLREMIPHLMGLTWDDELWVRTMIAEKVAFQMRGRFGELEHPIKKELWYTLQRGIYDQDLLEHGATVPRAVRHATASTSLLWSLVREGESRVERLEREVKEAKADVLHLSHILNQYRKLEGLHMNETLAAFQQGTNEALEAMVANHQELIAGLKVWDNNIKGALARRDEKTEQLEDVAAVLTAQVVSLLSGRRDLYSSIALLLSKPITLRGQTHSYSPVANPGISEVSSQTRLERRRRKETRVFRHSCSKHTAVEVTESLR